MGNIKKFIFLLILFLSSCSGKQEQVKSVIKEDDLDLQMMNAYKEGMSALERGDVYYAAKKI